MDLAQRCREDRRAARGTRALKATRSAWLVAAMLVAGVALRVALQLPLHRYADEGDSVVIGFGVWEILAGDLRVFVATGYRMGALACYLGAAASLLVGSGRAALALEVFAVGVVQMFVWWRALLELTGWNRREAASARLLIFVALPSPAVVYIGLYWPNGYPETFLAATLVLWAGARFWRHGGTGNLFAFGLVIGFAFWMSMLTFAITTPLCAWLLWQRGRELLGVRQAVVLATGGLLGALPWLAFNLRYDWVSLRSNWAVHPASSLGAMAENTGRLFGEALPMLVASMEQVGGVQRATGGRLAFGLVALTLVGSTLVVLGGAVAVAWRDGRARPGRSELQEPAAGFLPILGLAAAIPATSAALFVFSAAGSMPGNTVRYVLPAFLVWPLLWALGWEKAGPRARRLLAVLTVAVLVGFASVVPWPWTAGRARMRSELAVQQRIVQRLEASGVEAVFGSFWEVYPVIFESHGRVAGSTLEADYDFHHLDARLPAGPCRWAFVGRGAAQARLAKEPGANGRIERFPDGRWLFIADSTSISTPDAVTCSGILSRLRADFRR